MIVSTLVSLITVRYTLQILGVENYGIYNVVGGVVGFMGIITGSMNSATQRYLAYELGRGDLYSFNKTFCMLLNVFMAICLIMIIILELGGNYFLGKLVIPSDRFFASYYIYHFSIITLVFSTLSIPYQSAIIVYEKMQVFSYITFFDVFSKLFLLLVLFMTPFDKLVSYGFIMMLSVCITNLLYFFYCLLNLKGCRYKPCWDTKFIKEISKYIGWNLFGSLSAVLNGQGQAIILNLFFGPVVNSAKAISDRINSLATSFSANFYMATAPQIIKSYASGEIDYMRNLVIKSSRMSFYLMMIVAIPLIQMMQTLLDLWLGKELVSFEMVRFSQYILVYSLIVVFENPITMSVRATGEIKKYQLLVGFITLLFLPLCYVLFKIGYPAYYSMILLSIVYLFAQIVRVQIVSPIINVSVWNYMKTVLIPSSVLALVTYLITYQVLLMIPHNNVILFFFRFCIAFAITVFCVYIMGLTKHERKYIKIFLKSKLFKKKCKQQ